MLDNLTLFLNSTLVGISNCLEPPLPAKVLIFMIQRVLCLNTAESSESGETHNINKILIKKGVQRKTAKLRKQSLSVYYIKPQKNFVDLTLIPKKNP